ncbi:MAG: preprotein translocase subunit SecY [Crocinitomicaceae bacterium]|jgi:preprotein translocase subunit SecY|nr:preprotein translocase subunit SecY [Crocinitomicaceae bacterium]MDP4761221.1 preprotein translocase subunit SecY [Crocinitomicaceae bacterium]
MKRFIQNIQNIWKVEELRKRILLTLGLILVYRIGSFVIIPGVNYEALSTKSSDQNLLETLLSVFSGGGFTNASIMALGIMPYISASIIMQLLGMAVPAVQKMQSEGESGRKQINNYTRILTIIICALQAPSYLSLYVDQKQAMPADATTFWWTQTILILIAGSMFAVWLGERITEKGIGNGVSLLITVGILSRLPSAFFAEVFGSKNYILLILEVVFFMIIILFTILIVQGVRRIPLNTAKRIAGARAAEDMNGARNYLPIKVNASGVMPIIFAQAIMTIPMMVYSSATGGKGEGGFLQRTLGDPYGFSYNLLLCVLIIVFTYFYTAIMINPSKIADDLKKSGGFVPGVRPGEETADHIDSVVSRITFPGSLFLALIAILPAIAKLAGVNDGFAMFFGGTSVLIMVGVVLDTLQQIETYQLNRNMDTLMDGTRVRGRKGANEFSGM